MSKFVHFVEHEGERLGADVAASGGRQAAHGDLDRLQGGSEMRKKTNPRRVPVTRADVERAHLAGRLEGIQFAGAVFFTALADKEGYDNDALQRAWRAGEDISDSIAQGYINFTDLLRTLREERGINIG